MSTEADLDTSSEPKLENFLIPLEEIRLGTDDFSGTYCIGGGGFGKVYKGKLAKFGTNNLVAIKRLDPKSFQGKHEFKTEVSVLHSYKHENIIGFLGYCDEEGEMIIVSEYAINGSLDKHLYDRKKMHDMTWLRRLEICVGAARGLNHLHSGTGVHTGIIHRDVKSANILLDKNWKAKVSDFGLSRIGREDQPYTHIYTRVAGTPGYCDPYYRGFDILAKESDVYSLGVVLFEMLCGRLVFAKNYNDPDDSNNDLNLVGLVWRNRDDLDEIIDPRIRETINPEALCVFKEIAMNCLEFDYRKRPTMAEVLEKLEQALESQHDTSWMLKLLRDYEENSDSKKELHALLSEGVLFDGGKKWFSLSKMNGKNSVIISARELLKERDHIGSRIEWEEPANNSRFKKVLAYRQAGDCNSIMKITTEMLSLETAYAVLLICKGEVIYGHDFCYYGRRRVSRLGSAECRADEWMEIELFQFINHMETPTLEFHIEWNSPKSFHDHDEGSKFWVEGIECRPIDMKQQRLYWERRRRRLDRGRRGAVAMSGD